MFVLDGYYCGDINMDIKKMLLNWFYQQNENHPFVIQKIMGKKAGYRVEYPSGRYDVKHKLMKLLPDGKQERHLMIEQKLMDKTEMINQCNQRQILPFEICFDIDSPSMREVHNIQKKLNDDNIKYSTWSSGGKGHHIHCFFKDLPNYNQYDREVIRELFLKKYGSTHTDMMKKSEGHMIQMELAIHRNTQREKSKINDLPIAHIYYNNSDCNSILPHNIVSSMLIQKIKIVKKYSHDNSNDMDINYERTCIKYFMTGIIIEGSRDNALYALLSRTKYQMDFDEQMNLAYQFNNRNDCGYSSGQILSKVTNIRNSKNVCGCRFIKPIMEMNNKKEMCEKCLWNGV